MSQGVVAQSFRELVVWQRAIQLAAAVYRLTREFPREETYGLSSQMRRCAVSIAGNIAEGQGRLTTGEFRQFLGIARGSNFEIQTQIEIARVLGIGDTVGLDETESVSHEVGKMIYAILDSTKRNPVHAPASDH
ncbi:MAG: four helix bundle protein [Terracidiphilus sp.]